MKAYIFLIINMINIVSKFQLYILYTLEVKTESEPTSGIDFDVLMYFHNNLIPSVTFLFTP